MFSAMIVDDEPLMLKYLKENLTRIAPEWELAGIACNGLQAIELLQKQYFDAVITDIKMPEMDGLELSKYICQNFSETKIVIISGFDDFEYARSAIRCGVSDYLLKPLNDNDIFETLKKLSDHSKMQSSLLIKKDDNDINCTAENKLIEMAKKYIYLHYREPLSLSVIADKLNVTTSYLSDLFHKSTGESYSKFITKLRMQQAIKLIKANPDEKIYEIAEKVGFVNSKHFNSVFKKFYNVTPTEFRQNFINNNFTLTKQ